MFDDAESKQNLSNWSESARYVDYFAINGAICDYVTPLSPPSFSMTPSSKPSS